MGARRPSAPSPQPCPLSQLGRSAPRPRPRDGPKRASGCCILQSETLPAANHIPYLPWLMKAAQAVFAPGPALSIGQSGAGLPLAPWALLLCWGFPAPESHSTQVLLRGQAGLGVLSPSSPRPRPGPLSQHGRSAPRPRRSDSPKRASGSCILQRESLFGQPTTAPMRLGSGKQR